MNTYDLLSLVAVLPDLPLLQAQKITVLTVF